MIMLYQIFKFKLNYKNKYILFIKKNNIKKFFYGI